MACQGEHRFFIAEVIGVEATGKVYPIIVCTACGEVRSPEVVVSPTSTQLRLLKSEEKKGERA